MQAKGLFIRGRIGTPQQNFFESKHQDILNMA